MPDYVGQLRVNGELFAAGAERDLDALDSHVPSCPEWNVGKLVIHMGQHHRWVADAIRRAGEPPAEPDKPGRRGAELVAWLRDGWQELADLLDTKSDGEPCWTWWTERNVGFWRRRTALETLVHRWDVENATGPTTPLDPELSSDGVDEMFFVMMPDGSDSYAGPAGTVCFKTTDTGDCWLVNLTAGPIPRAERVTGNVDADLVVSAPAEELLLFMWGRKGPEAIEVDDPSGLFEPLYAWLRD